MRFFAAIPFVFAAWVVACDDGGQSQDNPCPNGTQLCSDGSCQLACNEGVGGSVITPVDPGPISSPDCTDSSISSGKLTQQYGGATISTQAGGKSYYLHSNWWYEFDGQTIDYNGLSFTVTDTAGAAVSVTDGNPLGYPSLFIGSYTGHATTGSKLPVAVSAITSVPTVFSTNAADQNMAHHNAAYDVWLTAQSTALGVSDYTPGPGGAYLMVWMFDPTNRQPRGSRVASRAVVDGVEGTWDIWVDRTDPACISYVSSTPRNGLAFDLNHFIRESVDNARGITDSMYLSIIFAGFEIWGGGNGLSVKNFCASVNP